MSPKVRWFASCLGAVLVADIVTKRIAERALQPMHVPHEVLGDVLRFTLTYNTGAAFSMSLGAYSRWGFTAMAVIVLTVLWRNLVALPLGDRWQSAALGLVCGGAIGNVIDRLRHTLGVVDFIDVGLNGWRFWTFNVADSGVTVGAIMLALAMLRTPATPPATQRVL